MKLPLYTHEAPPDVGPEPRCYGCGAILTGTVDLEHGQCQACCDEDAEYDRIEAAQ